MNVRDVLKYGHKDVVSVVEGLSETEWEIPEVTTTWSVKDTIGHLAAYELMLEDAFTSVLDPSAPTPTLEKMKAGGKRFNEAESASRRARSGREVLDEYNAAYDRVVRLLDRLTPERLREPGTIPWYGAEYSLDDFIVYANYAHKREHVAQIRLFLKRRRQS
jgi:uncharacterized damage-inducible protein DinB